MPPAQLVQVIASNFKNLGGIVGTLEDALNDTLPLGELVDIAGRFRGDTRQFHEMVTGLLTKVQGGIFHEEEGDAVNLLTYFKAKGWQWHTVIIPGANQKVIPHSRSKVEDERRLFYVALTRATHNLILSYVRQAVRSPVEPSQFLREMGLDKGEEKRSTSITGLAGIAAPSVLLPQRPARATSPPAGHAPAQPMKPMAFTTTVESNGFPADGLIEVLDKTLYPVMAGTPPQGSRRARLNRCRMALTSCSSHAKAEDLFTALARCDTAIATGNYGLMVKEAIQTWCRPQNSSRTEEC